MIRCPQCDRYLSNDESVCPECVPSELQPDEIRANDVRRLVPIARFRNVAEAGFFAHELMQRDEIAVTMTADESFDAVNGYWSTHYVLSAPEKVAQRARRSLQDLIQVTESDEPDHSYANATFEIESDTRFEHFDQEWADHETEASQIQDDVVIEDSNVNWVPIVLTLAAGSIVF